jgi:Fur family peroxide stress response transcriptional regulator
MRENHELDASIIRALRGNGYKATPQRIAIGRFTLLSRNHPTILRIYGEVKKTYPTVSLSTVYKTIKILQEVGLVQELNYPKDQTRFDSSMEPHIHLVCLSCGNIEDAKNFRIQDVVSQVSAAENFVVKGQRFDIYGICQSCCR